MINRIKELISLPTIEGDEDTIYEAQVINLLLWLLSGFSLIALVVRSLVLRSQTSSILINAIQLVIWASLIVVLRRGQVRQTGTLLIAVSFISANVQAYISGGVNRPIIYVNVLILALATLFSNRSVLLLGSLTVIAVIAMYFIDGIFIPSQDTLLAPASSATVYVLVVLFTSVILQLASNNLRTALSRARTNEKELSIKNKELQEYQQNLEDQVQARTKELSNRRSELEKANSQIQRRAAQFEALAQVSQSTSAIRDLQELLPQIASVISDKYGFYHVGIFLIDVANEYAVLTATNSEGGQRMLERQHRLKVGEQGIVGSVTATGQPRIALDVGADAVFFNNPDLPQTHSEMALPLHSSGKIIGALDVQSTESGAFTDDDVQTISLLADQVSLAIENARLFEDSRRTLEELQMISHQTTRDAWKRLPQQQKILGYRYNATGPAPLKQPVNLAGSSTGKDKANGDETAFHVVPIELRGQVIGNLVVQSPKGNQWNNDQKDLIKAVADRVALSAENARLFEETNQRAERERLVSEITGKIRHYSDPEAMIEVAVSELKDALGATRVEVIPQKAKRKEEKE